MNGSNPTFSTISHVFASWTTNATSPVGPNNATHPPKCPLQSVNRLPTLVVTPSKHHTLGQGVVFHVNDEACQVKAPSSDRRFHVLTLSLCKGVRQRRCAIQSDVPHGSRNRAVESGGVGNATCCSGWPWETRVIHTYRSPRVFSIRNCEPE